MPIYMRFTTGNGQVITGDARATGHAGWITLGSAQLGVGRNRRSPSGTGTAREVLPVQEIIVTKNQDDASTALFKQSLWGEPAKVEIDFVKAENGKETTYMSVTLEGTLLSSYSVSGHGGGAEGKPMESLVFNAQTMSYALSTAGRLVTGATAKP